jgi:hypothetical protein
MKRNQFIHLLAGGGAIAVSGAYAGLLRKNVFHGYGNNEFGREISGGIMPEMNGKPVPDGAIKKVAICATNITYVHGGLSLRGKNGEVLAMLQRGSMVHIVFGKKPFRLYLLHTPDDMMKDKEYCVFRVAQSEFPPRCLPLWDSENGFILYVEAKTLRERAAWWLSRGNQPRKEADIQLAQFIEKATIENRIEKS